MRYLVRDRCASIGRPSIDPEVFFKLQEIAFFEGIRSERRLMEMVDLNLAHRWYTGYALDEPVPDHSRLSKIRERCGIFELCIEAGLVWGRELYFDGTRVRANASIDGMVPRYCFEAKHHLEELFAQDQGVEGAAEAQQAQNLRSEMNHARRGLVEKYRSPPVTNRRKPWYQRQADLWVSPTDPDASPVKGFPRG